MRSDKLGPFTRRRPVLSTPELVQIVSNGGGGLFHELVMIASNGRGAVIFDLTE